MEIRFHLWMSGWSPAGSGDVFGGGGSVPVACTRQSHMVATENPTWEAPSVFSTNSTSLLKARAKSFESNYLKNKLPQVLIPVIKQVAGFYRDWSLTDVVARPWWDDQGTFCQTDTQTALHTLKTDFGTNYVLAAAFHSCHCFPPFSSHCPAWEQPIVSASPQDFQSTNPQQPSPGNSKSNRALPPKLPKNRKLPQEEVPSIPHSSESFWMSGHLPPPLFCPILYLKMKWKNLDFSLWQGWFSHQGQPSWEIWFLYSQCLVKHATANGWKWNQPPAEGVEDRMSWRALLHHLSRNPAEMLQSLKIIEARTVPFFSLASSFPPFSLETYPHRGSSTQQMKCFSKAHCERLQCRQSRASLHILPRNQRNTLCTASFVSFFCYSINTFILFYLVFHKVEETHNLCSAYLMFREAKETNL